MPKIRDYASEDTLTAALEREGLLNVAVFLVEPSGDGKRVKPVFLTVDPALIERLDSEGFEHCAPMPAADADTDIPAERAVGMHPALGMPYVVNHGGGHGNQHGQAPGPDDDESGEMVAAGSPPAEPEDKGHEGDGAHAIVNDTGIPNRRSPINIHISDLFFNYSHDGYDELISTPTEVEGAPVDGSALIQSIRDDAEEFTESILGAFGIAVNVDELVDDFFERL